MAQPEQNLGVRFPLQVGWTKLINNKDTLLGEKVKACQKFAQDLQMSSQSRKWELLKQRWEFLLDKLTFEIFFAGRALEPKDFAN